MYRHGAIVLVPFPFTNLTGSKVRPAVIISKGKIGQDVVVLFITSQSKSQEPHLVSVAPNTQNNLKSKSHIVCSKLATLDTGIILGEIGMLAPATQSKIDKKLKTVFGLT